MNVSISNQSWLGRARDRTRAWRLEKAVCTTLGYPLFFVGYFLVLNNPLFPVTTMPITALDRMVGFQVLSMPLYLSLWVYISIVPALIESHRELRSYWISAVMISVIGLLIFALWPSQVLWPDAYSSASPAFEFLKSLDAPGNSCPSLHSAFAVFSALWLERLLREIKAGVLVRAVNITWCLGILYSTIAIRQHVVVDLLAGALLGASVTALQLYWLRFSNRRALNAA